MRVEREQEMRVAREIRGGKRGDNNGNMKLVENRLVSDCKCDLLLLQLNDVDHLD